MVTRKGKRKHLIRQIRESLYDIGRPATVQEILDNSSHLQRMPTVLELANVLRVHKEFIITSHHTSKSATKIDRNGDGNYSCNLYWVADTNNIAPLRKCRTCGCNIAKKRDANTCSSCYMKIKRKERAECGKT